MSSYKNFLILQYWDWKLTTFPFSYDSQSAEDGSLTLLHFNTLGWQNLSLPLGSKTHPTLEAIFCCCRKSGFPWEAFLPGCGMGGTSLTYLPKGPFFLDDHVSIEADCEAFPWDSYLHLFRIDLEFICCSSLFQFHLHISQFLPVMKALCALHTNIKIV